MEGMIAIHSLQRWYKAHFRVLFILLLFLPCYSCHLAAESDVPSVTISFLPSSNKNEQNTANTLKQSVLVPIIHSLTQSTIIFNSPIELVFGSDDGPLYDPETHTIHIPYSFWTNSLNSFSTLYGNSDHKPTSAQTAAAIDVMLHTILHELGHAYIDTNDVPVLGKEEDAADNFATVILLNYVDNGASRAIHAAQLFDLEDQKIEQFDNLDFIDEHSLDIQRYYYTLCLVFGSNPDKYSHLFDEIELPFKTEREDICIDEFLRATDSWFTYLNASDE